MKLNQLISLAVALVLCGCASHPTPEHRATARPSRQYTIEEFMDTVRISGASFSADETAILVSSDETGIFNVFSIALGDGARAPVTRSTNDSTFAVSYFPRDGRVLFTRDAGGNEQNHLFVREANGTERDLTPGSKLKAQFVDWSGDDRAFYVATNERDARYGKSVEGGHLIAMNNLGVMLARGHGAEPDIDKARLLFARAASLGLRGAASSMSAYGETDRHDVKPLRTLRTLSLVRALGMQRDAGFAFLASTGLIADANQFSEREYNERKQYHFKSDVGC